jgi:HD superfamily phosphodiesterase
MCPPSAFAASNPGEHSTPLPAPDFFPQTPTSKAAYALASSLLSREILNHSIRVYLYAKTLAQRSNSTYFTDPTKHDLMFTACILHDIGTVSKYDGPLRFEVEGADAAVALLKEQGVSDEQAHEAWIAIAIHSSPHIAERINELSRTVREAVITDFGRDVEKFDDLAELKKGFESRFERLSIEKVLANKVVEQAKRNPEKAPKASWPYNLLRAYLEEPEYDGVNKGF